MPSPVIQLLPPVAWPLPPKPTWQAIQPSIPSPLGPDRLSLASPAALFSSTPRAVTADLRLALSDRNGINQPGTRDISGQLSGRVTVQQAAIAPALQKLKGWQTKKGPLTVAITDVRFHAPQRAYELSIRTSTLYGLVGDRFRLQLKTLPTGQLYLDLDKNWIPDGLILKALQQAIRQQAKNQLKQKFPKAELEIQMQRQGDKLFFMPVIQQIDLPLGKQTLRIHQLPGLASLFRLDETGNLHLDFNSLPLSASSQAHGSPPTGKEKPDHLTLHLQGHLMPDGQARVQATGRVNLDIDSRESQGIAFGGKTLSDVVDSLGLDAHFEAQLALDSQRKLSLNAVSRLLFPQVRIQGRDYQYRTLETHVALNTRQGMAIQATPQTVPGTFWPRLSLNTVEPIIDGVPYFNEMLRSIRGARESIALETYLYYQGDTTRRLTRELALKAVGLQETPQGLARDPLTPRGVPVHVLFNNSKLTPEGAKPTEQLFTDAVAALQKEIFALPLPLPEKQAYQERLARQLQWHSFAVGVAKADHRKILVIDGQTGFTGGINMGDGFLTEDSYHDIMVKVNGPAVREMHQEYIENWRDFGGDPQPSWNIKSETQLAAHRDAYARQHQLQPAALDVITTDDDSREIEAALISTIHKAQREINLEHPYFEHQGVQQALLAAVRRGVTLNIIIPDRSDEDLYNILNTNNVRELMQAQQQSGQGRVNAWLYTGRGGSRSHMAHTKALSVDGKYAIVGSANLTMRSLQSPFQQMNGTQGLFNEEMCFYIDDEKAVADLNRVLFETDRDRFSKAVSLPEIEERIRRLGGEKALQKEKLKALFG